MSNETEKKESVAPDRDRSDRRLHRLYDGDLSAEEKAALEQELAANPALGAKLEGLREIGVVVRAARTDDAPIDSEALWNGIEAKIASEAAAAAKPRPALRSIDGGKAGEAGRAGVAAPVRAAPVEDAAARRRRTIGIALGVFAIAAAALFVWLGQGEPERVADATPPASEATPGPDPDARPEAALAAIDYTEVLAVDFGTNTGTIFAVEGEEGQRYAVVWLDDIDKDEMDGTLGDGTMGDGTMAEGAGVETPN